MISEATWCHLDDGKVRRSLGETEHVLDASGAKPASEGSPDAPRGDIGEGSRSSYPPEHQGMLCRIEGLAFPADMRDRSPPGVPPRLSL